MTRVRQPLVCGNPRSPVYAAVEARVLASVQANLLHPDVIAESVRVYHEEMAAGQAAASLERAGLERELERSTRRAKRLIDQVADGMPWKAVAASHEELESRAAAIRAELAEVPPPNVVSIHPTAPLMYRKMVEDLIGALGEKGDRESAASRAAVRRLISEVRVLPRAGKGHYELSIVADLAPVIAPAAEPMMAPNRGPSIKRYHRLAPAEVIPLASGPWQVRLKA